MTSETFNGKTLLITGGTGSFGKAVLKKFLTSGVQEIRIFSRDEKKQDDMRRDMPNSKIKYYIGDVRDPKSLEAAVAGAHLIFHAAALKQVPSCEFYPLEAVKTNVLGTENVVSAACQAHAERVIILSTDKAVYPVNAMGLTKSLAEKIMIAKARSLTGTGTILCGTRYGNVMASRGSVIPLFVKQIKANQPITITDPSMTRFLMSIDEAVTLVLTAYQQAKQGDIVVQKSPACTMLILAEALKEVFSSEVPIQIIGTRHGEKKHETLVSREELVKSEAFDRYYRIPSDDRDLNYEKFFSTGQEQLSTFGDYTSENTERLDRSQVKSLLLSLDYIQKELNHPQEFLDA